MGIRGFITFATDGEIEHTAYNHFDSYPDHLGNIMYTFVRDMVNAEGDEGIEARRAAVRNLVAVDENASPTAAEIETFGLERFHQNVSTGDDWYAYLRSTQGDPGAILDCGFYVNASLFPLDSLFAEWGYVVDFDREVVEVYKGFQREAHELGRFATRVSPDGEDSDEFYPVALIEFDAFADIAEMSDEDIVARMVSIEDEAR